ncbi:MAG: hypothetical protein DWQ36_13495 [Acidobacteria bacterium]|nr:MAG: hypothetical protein DWQ30_12055 [Acidobacteriota bacterium]REK06225.1 MAG: hypothetical protein DWQ36_13495 [Acidobacteriota bacterium]
MSGHSARSGEQSVKGRRRRSILRAVVYLAVAALLYLSATDVLGGGPMVGTALAALLLTGGFFELLFWRELIFGHPRRD